MTPAASTATTKPSPRLDTDRQGCPDALNHRHNTAREEIGFSIIFPRRAVTALPPPSQIALETRGHNGRGHGPTARGTPMHGPSVVSAPCPWVRHVRHTTRLLSSRVQAVRVALQHWCYQDARRDSASSRDVILMRTCLMNSLCKFDRARVHTLAGETFHPHWIPRATEVQILHVKGDVLRSIQSALNGAMLLCYRCAQRP